MSNPEKTVLTVDDIRMKKFKSLFDTDSDDDKSNTRLINSEETKAADAIAPIPVTATPVLSVQKIQESKIEAAAADSSLSVSTQEPADKIAVPTSSALSLLVEQYPGCSGSCNCCNCCSNNRLPIGKFSSESSSTRCTSSSSSSSQREKEDEKENLMPRLRFDA